MSYQVLARKYRPASFQDLEGQEHVLQALINALDNNRLHHAYLFTGTRGVGKTTIARILARCLNCETGVTSTPCGECNSCLEIAEGRSVDLIEVDAASRTGVDDMRELLDNVQYMPTVSRFKIYLIDEVHMLSRSSFNAMLKTLEEPPEHVKFLFATTDPKKLPITVLSRCLQFNLKNLTPEQIVHYLDVVLGKESIASEEAALWQLGHAADGSMRDALSLTDQAISFGNGEVRDEPVRSMLGSIDQREVYDLLDAIIREDGAAMLAKIAELSEFAPDYAALLDDMMAILHRVAIAHAAADAVDNAQGDREQILETASKMPAEHVQLLYQIGLIGQRDLSLAPTPRMGFEMVLLRMMSFTPDEVQSGGQGSSGGGESLPHQKLPHQKKDAEPAPSETSAQTQSVTSEEPGENVSGDESRSRIADLMSVIQGETEASESDDQNQEKVEQETVEQEIKTQDAQSDNTQMQDAHEPSPAIAALASALEAAPAELEPEPEAPVRDATPQVKPETKNGAKVELESFAEPSAKTMGKTNGERPEFETGNWSQILSAITLDGMTRNLASNCLLISTEDDHAMLKMSEQHASLWSKAYQARIADALTDLFGREIRVSIEVGATDLETPAQTKEREQLESRAQAVADIESDHHVQQLIENFNGKLDPNSIRPLGS